MATLILAVGVVYFFGHLLTHFFERSKIPDVLMLILIGIVVGPVTGLITVDAEGSLGRLFTQFALILILFEGGLNLEVRNLIHSARQSVILTISFFALSTILIASIMHWGFDYSPMASVLTGFICGGTSSAVVIPLLGMINVGQKTVTTLVIESALTDVLCIVFTIGQIDSIESGAFEYGKIIGTIASSLVMASLIGVVCGFLWLRSLNYVRSFNNTQYATCFFMFIIYGVAELLNFSGAIAALAYGIVIGNRSILGHLLDDMPMGVVSDAEKKLYKELVFLVKIFFFLYIGMCMPLADVGIMIVALALVIALYAARPIAAKFIVSRDTSAHDRSIVSVMLPKGLAAAVLAGMPSEAGMVEGRDIQAITYYVVLFSIVLTSALVPLIERTNFGKHLARVFEKNE